MLGRSPAFDHNEYKHPKDVWPDILELEIPERQVCTLRQRLIEESLQLSRRRYW